MPRYFFDTYDGDRFLPDDAGLEFESLEAARSEAQKISARDGTGSAP
jgi:hypothetical protein